MSGTTAGTGRLNFSRSYLANRYIFFSMILLVLAIIDIAKLEKGSQKVTGLP